MHGVVHRHHRRRQHIFKALLSKNHFRRHHLQLVTSVLTSLQGDGRQGYFTIFHNFLSSIRHRVISCAMPTLANTSYWLFHIFTVSQDG